jgi:hypothetical protein
MIYRINQPNHSSSEIIKRLFFGLSASIFMVFAPIAQYVFAEGADNSTSSGNSSCSPVAPAPTGIISPTGSDAVTYTYDSCTGLWVNPYYTWSPATQTATPITPYVYTCNTNSWKWDYLKWVYDPSSQTWSQISVSTDNLPADAIIATDSLIDCAPVAPSSNTDPSSSNTDSSISNTGPNSTNTTTDNGTNNTTIGNSTSVTLANQIGSQATTGNALVVGDTTGGSATSGNATTTDNVLNSVQSATGLNGNVTTFVANINGDVQGNLIVDPSQLQPTTSSSTLNNNLTINSQNNGQIDNNINLASDSGNATVADNTSAGNATSGNAETVADIVNSLDSIISSGQSFVGVININGNLNGNILMPQSFINSLIASNAPSTTMTIPQNVANNLGITNNNNEAITNNVTSNATSGNATVADNTSAGSATSGSTSTKVTVFNLTGSEVIGTNCLLVFVNVSGTWVGVIMNAPAGTTAAALGSGITENTNNNTTVNNNNNNSITNNINVAAESGNANVKRNTSAGNATSGNADTAVNLLNLNNTQFDLTGWFGILFINVFGNWNGSFGVYSPPTPTTSSGSSTDPAATTTPTPKVFSFVPSDNSITSASDPVPNTNAQLVSKVDPVLGDSIAKAIHVPAVATTTNSASHTSQIIGGILLILGIGTLIAERIISQRRGQQST